MRDAGLQARLCEAKLRSCLTPDPTSRNNASSNRPVLHLGGPLTSDVGNRCDNGKGRTVRHSIPIRVVEYAS